MTEKSKTLAKKDTTSMAINTKKTTLENVDMSMDVTIPRIKFLQPTSDEVTGLGAKAGNFFNKITGEQFETLDIVPVYMFKQRLLFDKDTQDLVCRSNNSMISDQGLYEGKRCSECPLSKWKDDQKTAKKNPPECMLTNNFLVYTKEDIKNILNNKFVFPKVLSFGKTAYPCSKEIISTALFQGMDLFCFQYTLKTTLRKKDKYNYFVPVIATWEKVSDNAIKLLANMLPAMRDLVGHFEIEVKDISEVQE